MRGNINFFLRESFFKVQMKLCVNFQRARLDYQEVPRLLGVSILSFKEAKETFLTPVIGNMNFFLQKPFCMVQIKLHVNFQSPRWSGSALE